MAKENFEQLMTELEATVKKMEAGDSTLDESLELFERGIKLSKKCQSILENAEKKVTVLLASESGAMEEQPFDTEKADV